MDSAKAEICLSLVIKLAKGGKKLELFSPCVSMKTSDKTCSFLDFCKLLAHLLGLLK